MSEAAMDESEQGNAAQAENAGATLDTGALDLAVVRDLVLKANPGVVAELVTGDTPAAILASVPHAEAAYQRIVQAAGGASSAAEASPAVVVVEPVAIGSPPRSQGPDVESMSPAAKIAYGVNKRAQG